MESATKTNQSNQLLIQFVIWLKYSTDILKKFLSKVLLNKSLNNHAVILKNLTVDFMED